MGGGSSHFKVPDDTRFVIVGGGYAGMSLGVQLLHTGKMKLINPSEFFFHNVGALRSCVEPEFAKKTMIKFEPTFGDAFVRGKVVKINKEKNSVTLDNGREISYTHLFLATGALGPFPGKITEDYPEVTVEEGLKLYKDINNQIVKAETVVCIGGGPVGVELAGEIKTDYPNKKVILIHANDALISPKMKTNAQNKLQDVMRRKGIEIILNERVSNLSDLQENKCVKNQVVRTDSGKEIKTDLIFRCIGTKPTSINFRADLGDAVNDKGFVKVDEHLKVEGTENIYALGYITDLAEDKMTVTALNHADLIAKNLRASFSNKKQHSYKLWDFAMIVPVGRDAGVGQLPKGIVVGDFVSKNLKSKHLFAGKFWDMMKQKKPQ